MIKLSVNLDMGARNFPIVSGFRTNFCGDPNCGPHLFLLDKDDQVFAEFIMSAEQVTKLEQDTMEHIAGIPKKPV
jgi:hypothetical protein